MSSSTVTLHSRLVDRASQYYRGSGRFAFHFARGKLGADPVFMAMLERGLFPDNARILDLGCGQGLLAAWLFAGRQLYDAGEWPADWPAPPQLADIRGVDLLARDVQRARASLSIPAHFEEGNMLYVDYGQVDVVVIMDVLHYVDFAAQDDILRRVYAALPIGGLFITRVGDAGAGLRFKLSNWVDRTVAFLRGSRLRPMHCRLLQDWVQTLEQIGFSVEMVNMNGALPLANVMIIARPKG